MRAVEIVTAVKVVSGVVGDVSLDLSELAVVGAIMGAMGATGAMVDLLGCPFWYIRLSLLDFRVAREGESAGVETFALTGDARTMGVTGDATGDVKPIEADGPSTPASRARGRFCT